jgi:hypothetical protein|tara:strand:- start:6397 stop:7020 length:624 start_codon:yes stop_codon:yes gene_type:complete
MAKPIIGNSHKPGSMNEDAVVREIEERIKMLRRLRGSEEAQMSEFEVARRILKRLGWDPGVLTSQSQFELTSAALGHQELLLPNHRLVFEEKSGRLVKMQYLSPEQGNRSHTSKAIKTVLASSSKLALGVDWRKAEENFFDPEVLQRHLIPADTNAKRAFILGALSVTAKIVRDIHLHGISSDEVSQKLIEQFKACGGSTERIGSVP